MYLEVEQTGNIYKAKTAAPRTRAAAPDRRLAPPVAEAEAPEAVVEPDLLEVLLAVPTG